MVPVRNDDAGRRAGTAGRSARNFYWRPLSSSTRLPHRTGLAAAQLDATNGSAASRRRRQRKRAHLALRLLSGADERVPSSRSRRGGASRLEARSPLRRRWKRTRRANSAAAGGRRLCRIPLGQIRREITSGHSVTRAVSRCGQLPRRRAASGGTCTKRLRRVADAVVRRGR